MSRAFTCLLAGLLLLAGAGCNGTASLGPAVTPEELAQAGLQYYWQREIPLEGERIERIWQLDEKVYCLTGANRVLAYDAVSGVLAWTVRVGDSHQRVYAPVHADGVLLPRQPGRHLVIGEPDVEREGWASHNLVVFNTVTYALLLDRGTGRLLHRIDFGDFAASTGCAIDGASLYVPSANGWINSIDLKTGLRRWPQTTGGAISAQPVFRNGLVYVANRAGRVLALQGGAEPVVSWSFQPGGSFVADFALRPEGLFAGNLNYSVYSIDPLSGRPLWRQPLPGPVREPVQVGRNNVYALTDEGSFHALDLAKGTEKWSLPNARMVLAEPSEQEVLLLSDADELLAVDASTGQVRTAVALTGLNLFVPNTRAPAIFAAHRDGRLVCLRARGAERLIPEMLQSTPRPAAAQERP